MLIDRKKIAEAQLNASGPCDFEGLTQLTPSRYTPRSDRPALYLNGVWQVKKWPFPADFMHNPGGAEMTGYEQPGKVFYADSTISGPDRDPNWNRVSLAHISDEDGAAMFKTVTIPAAWRGKTVMLRFDAVYPAADFYLDGKFLGAHRSGLTPWECDVTALVTPGESVTIGVRLYRKHKFVKMDMPRHALEFAGLAQDAYLFALEPAHITEYRLVPELGNDFRSGAVRGFVKFSGDRGGTLRIALDDGRKLEIPVAPGETECAVDWNLGTVEPWSDEFPRLYWTTLEFGGETYTFALGFRKLELSPAGCFLNGTRVKFRGVNHLTFHPDFGLYTPKAWLRQVLGLMKKANVNAIRTHFAGPPALCELCDELGIYLLQEIPIDWGTNYIHDPEWVGPALQRIEGVVRRDRHHPSLMVWSVGNENMPERAAVAEDGWNHLKLYDEFVKILDPSRPTMFPPPGPANKIVGIFELRVGDVADTHYSFNHARNFLKDGRIANPNSWEAEHVSITREEALARGWKGVWFSSEWGITNMIPDLLNAPAASIIDDFPEDPLSGRNSLEVFCARLDREWTKLMRACPTCLGGAYFPFMSSSAAGPGENPWGWMRFGESADWGVVCADLTAKPGFWALRTAFSPVHFPKRLVWRKGQADINFELENQFNRIDLADCTLRCQFTGIGKWMTMVHNFTDVPVACPPGEKRVVHIPLPDDNFRKSLDEGKGGCVRFTLLDPKGFKVIVAELLVLGENQATPGDAEMPIGPDAVIEGIAHV